MSAAAPPFFKISLIAFIAAPLPFMASRRSVIGSAAFTKVATVAKPIAVARAMAPSFVMRPFIWLAPLLLIEDTETNKSLTELR